MAIPLEVLMSLPSTSNRPVVQPPRPPVAVRPVVVAPTPAPPVAVKPAPAPVKPAPAANPGRIARAKTAVMEWALATLHGLMNRFPRLNGFVGNITGPIVKARFNPPPGTHDAPGPAPLEAATIEGARKLMAERFKPAAGKVVIGISGGGSETVHCFVVSGVKPDGTVMITQALAQYGQKTDAYEGLGGKIRKWMDGKKGNQGREMLGVVEESWSAYAVRSHRNSVVLMEMDADPEKIEAALRDLKSFVGRPYDRTMLASDPATKASEAGMYCTEVSSWFVNRLRPGTVKMSKSSGYPVFQVADHMRATDVHGGPLKVLYNGQNRLDLKNVDPFPKDR